MNQKKPDTLISSDEYEEGYSDFWIGLDALDCPYEPYSAKHEEWLRGYWKAVKDYGEEN